MSDLSAVLVLLAASVASLFVVSAVNRQQVRRRLKAQRVGQLKRRISELEDLSNGLLPLLESPGAAVVVQQELIELLRKLCEIDNGDTSAKVSLDNACSTLNQLEGSHQLASLDRLKESDSAVARAQYHIAEAARIARRQEVKGLVQPDELTALLKDLSWADMMVKITSNVGQGHKTIHRGGGLRAYAFYRRALEIATESSLKDPRIDSLVSELEELVNLKRRALSENLMPETRYNPKEDAPFPSASLAGSVSHG